jgi:hypothetical protein
MRLTGADDFLDPNRFLGTDQAFLRHLHSNDIIEFRHDPLPGKTCSRLTLGSTFTSLV